MTASWYNRRSACVSFDLRSYAFIASIRRWNTNREWDVVGRSTWIYTHYTSTTFDWRCLNHFDENILKIAKVSYTFLHSTKSVNMSMKLPKRTKSQFCNEFKYLSSSKSFDYFSVPFVDTVASEAQTSTTAIQPATIERRTNKQTNKRINEQKTNKQTKQFQNKKSNRDNFFAFYMCWFPSVCNLSLDG